MRKPGAACRPAWGLFRTRRTIQLQRRGEGGSYRPVSVAATLCRSIGATVGRHPAMRDLLYICALLGPDAIPEEFFRQGAGHLGSHVETVGHDPLEWDRVIAIVCEYSLLSRQADAQTLGMHRLVQAVLQESLREAEREQWTRRVHLALNALFPEVTCDVWERCECLLPHALAFTVTLSARAGERNALRELLRKVADYLRERARYEQAELLYRLALQMRKQAPETLPGALAVLLGGLALLSRKQGKYRQTQCSYQRALQLQEQVPAANPLAVADLLDGLVRLCVQQGAYEQAEVFQRRARQMREQMPESGHPLVVHSLDGLAYLYTGLGRYERAEPLYWRALQIRERVLPPAHPDQAVSLHGLALLSLEQGRDRRRRVVSAGLAAPLYRLALIYFELGNIGRVELCYRRALQIWERVPETRHPDAGSLLATLGAVSAWRGKYEQAEALYRQTLQICERRPVSRTLARGRRSTTWRLCVNGRAISTRPGRWPRVRCRFACNCWETLIPR